jgi:ribonuclease PH
MFQRQHNRDLLYVRPIKITFDPFSYATASVLLEIGNTKVLSSVSLQPGVPQFLRAKGEGWLTAEYALLPHATTTRTVRDGAQRSNGRAVEISRVIGRSLRAVVDLGAIVGEKTLYVDCDVLQADGGTRVACIIAASLAIERAQAIWLSDKSIRRPLLKERIAAVSLGIIKDDVLVDPDFSEDLLLDADFNFILTQSGQLIEIQGGAEKNPISWNLFEKMRSAALVAVAHIFRNIEIVLQKTPLKNVQEKPGGIKPNLQEQAIDEKKFAFFSLKNRLTDTKSS